MLFCVCVVSNHFQLGRLIVRVPRCTVGVFVRLDVSLLPLKDHSNKAVLGVVASTGNKVLSVLSPRTS